MFYDVVLEYWLGGCSLILGMVCGGKFCPESCCWLSWKKEDRESVLQNSEMTNPTVAVVTTHGFEAVVDFKPVEHPSEPPDSDLPVKCPAPEPSILNDARVWKERLAGNAQRRAELPIMKDEKSQVQPEKTVVRQPSPPTTPLFLPSLSAPEHTIKKLLEECNESED